MGLVMLACFIYFLITYIKSFYVDPESKPAVDYSFDPDSMVITLLSGFLIVLAVLSVIKIHKNKFSLLFYSNVTLVIVSASFIYGLSRLIRMYVKEKDPTTYWVWFGIGLATVAVFAGASIYLYFRKKKQITKINESNQQA